MGYKMTDEPVTLPFLEERTRNAQARGYGKAKWIWLCEELLGLGYNVSLYEARRTYSKYITVKKGRKSFRVRISNHRPIRHREANGDCDFFVGVTNFGITTTEEALRAVVDHFDGKEKR